MTDSKDTGIAVSESKRLNDCYFQLTEDFIARPPVVQECEKWAKRIGPVAASNDADWLHRGNSANMAESYIVGAVMRGDFPLWVRLPDGEQAIDRYAIKEITHQTIVAGSYQPFNDTDSNLQGRPLWIKLADWEAFLRGTLAVRYGEICTGVAAPNVDASKAPFSQEGYVEAKSDWLELWQGPIHFRATFDKGKFGPGHSLERINQFGQEGATGGGRHAPIYGVRLDPNDGALVIEWLIGLPGRKPPFQTVRYYHGGLGRGLYERLREDPIARDKHFAHLPADQRNRAVGAYAIAISMREWAEREFFQAVHAGSCEIWARVGSKIAPFRRIPADIFRAYEIQEWGYGVPGGAWAKLEGAEPLFSIRVAAPAMKNALPDKAASSGSGQRAPAVKAGRPPSDDEILAKADEMKDRGLDGRTIAKQMRLEPGFENVATTAVRVLIKGRWKPAGRPKKAA